MACGGDEKHSSISFVFLTAGSASILTKEQQEILVTKPSCRFGPARSFHVTSYQNTCVELMHTGVCVSQLFVPHLRPNRLSNSSNCSWRTIATESSSSPFPCESPSECQGHNVQALIPHLKSINASGMLLLSGITPSMCFFSDTRIPMRPFFFR